MWVQQITTAIKLKRLIELTYSSERRIVEPHVLGVKAAKIQLRAWQIKNYAEPYTTPEWRTFDLVDISSLVITESAFPGARPTKSGTHDVWDQVIIRVD